MATPERIADLEKDLEVWDKWKAEADDRLEDLLGQQDKGVTWPDANGRDILPDVIVDVDEIARTLAVNRTRAKARLDRAKSGENV